MNVIKQVSYKSAILILLLIITLLPGCLPEEGTVADEDTVIRLGHLHNDLHQLAFYVAMEKGFYEDAGLAVEVAGVYKSGVELMAAFRAGVLDAGYVGLAPATVAVANGKADVVVVAQANQTGSALLVRDDLHAETPEDLAGLKIAVPNIGTVQDFLLNKTLHNAALTVADIEKVFMPPPEMISAMIAGGIDGCVVWEPYAAELTEQENGRILLTSDDIWKGHPCCVLAVKREFSKNEREKTAALTKAHRRATDFILENKEEAQEMAVAFTGLSPAVVEEAMQNIEFNYNLSGEKAALYAEFLSEQGMIEVSDPSEFTDSFTDTSFPGEGAD